MSELIFKSPETIQEKVMSQERAEAFREQMAMQKRSVLGQQMDEDDEKKKAIMRSILNGI